MDLACKTSAPSLPTLAYKTSVVLSRLRLFYLEIFFGASSITNLTLFVCSEKAVYSLAATRGVCSPSLELEKVVAPTMVEEPSSPQKQSPSRTIERMC